MYAGIHLGAKSKDHRRTGRRNAPTGVLVLDHGRRVTAFNLVAREMLDLPAEELLGRPGAELFPDMPGILDRLGQHSTSAEVLQEAITSGKQGKHPLVVTVNLLAWSSHPDTNDQIVLILQDADNLTQMDAELQRRNRLQVIERMTVGVVHEIKNPLTGISMNIQEMLERTSSKGPMHQELLEVLQDVNSIETIVNQLLDFAGLHRPQLTEVYLEDLAEEALRFSKLHLRRQGIRLQTELGQRSARIRVDVVGIKQVLLNVIFNARDAMSEGGELEVSTIYSFSSVDGNHVRLEFADTGHGIAAEHLPLIFEPFTTFRDGGTGLGLAISRSIMERHGGRIEARSRPGGGTTFSIVLPVN